MSELDRGHDMPGCDCPLPGRGLVVIPYLLISVSSLVRFDFRVLLVVFVRGVRMRARMLRARASTATLPCIKWPSKTEKVFRSWQRHHG